MDKAKFKTHSAAQRRRYRDQGFWQERTIYQIVSAHAKHAPGHFAVRERRRRLTYRQLVDAADRFAAYLSGAGIKAGQTVALWLPNRLETVVALLACSKKRLVCCPSLQRNHTVGEVLRLLARLQPALLITQAGYGADRQERDLGGELARRPHPPVHHVLPPVGSDNAHNPVFGDLDGLAETRQASVQADPDGLVYLALTSGTTAEPKGVMHSDNTLLANARALAADWRFDRNSVIHTLSPLSHNLGFGAMVTALNAGGEIVLGQHRREESLLADLARTGATFIYGVPAHALDLVKELRGSGGGAPGAITGFRISGAQAPGELVKELLDYGIRAQTGYGMTEAHSHNYTLPDDEPARIINSAGRACPGYEIKIWSLENPDVAVQAGEVGQVGGRGASLMLGYYRDETATASSFNAHGWFMTGDLGSLDAAGYLYLKGRIKDMIIRGGHNIYPARIEQLALRHPAIAQAAAVPFPDERLGEKVCLVVVTVDGAAADGGELLTFLKTQGLSKYDLPEYLAETDCLPLTPGGKVLKRELLDMIETGRLTVSNL